MLCTFDHNGMSLIELSVFHWFCVLVAKFQFICIDWWRFSLPYYPPWNNVFVILTHFATKTYIDTYILTIWSCLVCTLILGGQTINIWSYIEQLIHLKMRISRLLIVSGILRKADYKICKQQIVERHTILLFCRCVLQILTACT